MFYPFSYSANITALLQSPSTKIQTLEDLLNSRLKFGADDTVFNRYYFTVITYFVLKRYYLHFDKIFIYMSRGNWNAPQRVMIAA